MQLTHGGSLRSHDSCLRYACVLRETPARRGEHVRAPDTLRVPARDRCRKSSQIRLECCFHAGVAVVSGRGRDWFVSRKRLTPPNGKAPLTTLVGPFVYVRSGKGRGRPLQANA